MIKITLLNQKGGVGKTSTCHHLAGALAARGGRVLLVDNDPQASLTQGFWGSWATSSLAADATIAAVYAGDAPLPADLVCPTDVPGIDLLPGHRDVGDYNLPIGSLGSAPGVLRDLLAEVDAPYGLCLIDCPPNLNRCAWEAVLAADLVIVPLQPEDYGAQGIASVRELVAAAREWGYCPGLPAPMFLLTMVQRLAVHRAYESKLREAFGADVFSATVPMLAAFKEAIAAQLPAAQYQPKGKAAAAIEALACELLTVIPRLAIREGVA